MKRNKMLAYWEKQLIHFHCSWQTINKLWIKNSLFGWGEKIIKMFHLIFVVWCLHWSKRETTSFLSTSFLPWTFKINTIILFVNYQSRKGHCHERKVKTTKKLQRHLLSSLRVFKYSAIKRKQKPRTQGKTRNQAHYNNKVKTQRFHCHREPHIAQF